MQMTLPLISAIQTRRFNVPLAEMLVDAKHGSHTHFQRVTRTVMLGDDRRGTGYTPTGNWGGHATTLDGQVNPLSGGIATYCGWRPADCGGFLRHKAKRPGVAEAFKVLIHKSFLWRRDPESNRARRICNPLHNRFAIAPAFQVCQERRA